MIAYPTTYPGAIGWKRESRPAPTRTMRPRIVFTKHAVYRYVQRVIRDDSARFSAAKRQLAALTEIVPELSDTAPKWAYGHNSAKPDDLFFIPAEDVVFPVRFMENGVWLALTCLTRSMFWDESEPVK